MTSNKTHNLVNHRVKEIIVIKHLSSLLLLKLNNRIHICVWIFSVRVS